jgi:hypothetical protein
LNRDYVKLIQLSFDLHERLKRSNLLPDVRAALEEELRWAERNLGERYHAGIENKCQDILASLRRENDDFCQDESRCVDFLYFLSLQYFRTAKMREALSNIPSYLPDHDPRRTANILNHIHATNVGAGLFRERKAYRIVFLRNTTAIPLSFPRWTSTSSCPSPCRRTLASNEGPIGAQVSSKAAIRRVKPTKRTSCVLKRP